MNFLWRGNKPMALQIRNEGVPVEHPDTFPSDVHYRCLLLLIAVITGSSCFATPPSHYESIAISLSTASQGHERSSLTFPFTAFKISPSSFFFNASSSSCSCWFCTNSLCPI